MNILKFSGIFAGLLALTACTASAIEAPLAEHDPSPVDADYPPASEEVQFQSDGKTLNALFYLANGEGPHPTVLLLHGYPGNEKNLDIAQYLRRDGWNVFFFHYRGAWGSEGQFTFLNAAEDVGAALSFIRTHADEYRTDASRIVILGHSMGGRLALASGSDNEDVSCIATLAAAPLGPTAEDLANEEVIAGYKAYADSLIMLAGHDGSNVIEQSIAFGDAYPVERVSSGLAGKNLFLLAAEKDTAVPVAVHHQYVEAFSKDSKIDLTTKIYDTDHSFNSHRLAISRDITQWIDANCR